MELILFGNSPFLHQVNIPELLPHYATIGFNGFGLHHPVDAVFCFDHWFEPGQAKAIYHPHHIAAPKACNISHPFSYKASTKPLLKREVYEGFPFLAFKYFTPSIALNWAILEGFKTVYLIGIDNIETDTRFQHHDGAECRSELTPTAHQKFKQFVYECAKHIDIYQCNPAIRDGWALPFKDLKELYGPSLSQ